MKNINYFIFLFLLLLSIVSKGQTTKEEFFSDTNYAGGIYCPYIFVNKSTTPVPEGYTPFYISHYGRHGSRWLISTKTHTIPEEILGDAFKADKLTSLGKSLYERVKIVADDADGRYGDLAPLGVKEHKDIAERMYRSFPEVFSTRGGRKCHIYSRSTVVPRCILSMAANNERLKELNPEIEIVREASKKNSYLNNDANIDRDTAEIIANSFLRRNFNADRFISSLFNDTVYANKHIDDHVGFANIVFSMAINMANLDYLKISLFDVFTKDELFILWQASNIQMYFGVGPSHVNVEIVKQSATFLLRDILDCADNAIKNNNISADLRFGHDTYIIPLLVLLEVKGMNVQESDPGAVYKIWSNFKVSSMGTNLQLIFFRNDNNGDVLVKLLHCEKEVEIPVVTDVAPYYHWKDFKAYYQKKVDATLGTNDRQKGDSGM